MVKVIPEVMAESFMAGRFCGQVVLYLDVSQLDILWPNILWLYG